HILLNFLEALLSLFFEKCFCFRILDQDAELFENPIAIVHCDFLILRIEIVPSDGIFYIVSVVQYLLMPDLHDCPFHSPSVSEHFDFVDFIALNVEISLQI
ncbi:MAG: hypothetical protein ACK5NI_02065, partial [bacterium]